MKTKSTCDISERIRFYRNQLNLSQDYVANYLDINRATYCQLEKGKRKATVDNILRLTVLFGVSSNALLYGENTETSLYTFIYEFGQLKEEDRNEVLNFIRSKKAKT